MAERRLSRLAAGTGYRRESCRASVYVVLVTGLVGSFLAGIAGCAGEAVAPEPAEDSRRLYWRLTLNNNAINLSTTIAPYDTFRLVATPRTVDGEPVVGAASAVFASADPERVLVSPDGLVHGLQEATGVLIIVTLAHGTLTHADTALVHVTTNPPPVLARLSLEPDPADSAKGTMDGSSYYPTASIVTRAFDTDENELSDLAVWIKSSDSRVAEYNNVTRSLDFHYVGPVTFYASTVASGVSWSDTLEYTVGLPLKYGPILVRTHVTLDGLTSYRFNPSVVTVGGGAYVNWRRNRDGPAYDVTFDDPTNVSEDEVLSLSLPICIGGTSAGNIAPFDTLPFPGVGIGFCSRYFPVPRTYHYHSAVLNATGTILVVDESQTTAVELMTRGPRGRLDGLGSRRVDGPRLVWP